LFFTCIIRPNDCARLLVRRLRRGGEAGVLLPTTAIAPVGFLGAQKKNYVLGVARFDRLGML
jgi:hypothetical protein